MSREFWSNLNTIAGYFTIAALFAFAILSAHLEIKDLDLWLHVKTGEVIMQQGHVPNSDLYSATLNQKGWANHEWLFQVIVASVYNGGGFNALILMQVIVVTLTLLVLLLAFYRRERQFLIAFGLLVFMLIYQTRLTIRPDIFSILFLSLFLVMVFRAHRTTWGLGVLAILQIIWVNMHGFFIMGPVMIWLSLIGLWINQRVSGQRAEYGFLPTAAWLLPLVCLINPHGVHGAIYPVSIALHLNQDAGVFFKHIVELAQPITAANIWTDENGYYKLILGISLYSFIFNRRHMDWQLVLIWFCIAAFSLAAIRNMVYMGVMGYVALMINSRQLTLEDISPIRFIDSRFKFITGIVCKIILIGWICNISGELANNGYFDFDNYERKTEFEGISKRNFPYKAVDFLVENKVKGNFFNDFNSGSYLIGRAYPNIKVFIDGRTEVYGSDYFKQYQLIWRDGDKKVFEQLARKYNITGAFLNSFSQDIPPKAARLFYNLKGWHVVYFDDDALILLKDVPQHAAIIKKFGIDLTHYQSKSMDLQRLGPRRIAPFPYINRANTLYALGLKQQAMAEAKMALKVAPDYAAAYEIIGHVYLDQKEYQLAFNNLRTATMLYPHNAQTRFLLAQSYEGLKDYAGALKQYERLYQEAPSFNAKANIGIIRTQAAKGDLPQALAALKQIKNDNITTMDLIHIGDQFYSHQRYDEARAIYQRALTKKKHLDAIHYRIGLTYVKTNDTIAAQKELNAGLKLNPKHKGIKKALKKYFKSK